MADGLAKLRQMGFLARNVFLALATAATLAVVAPVAWNACGRFGVAAAGVAAGCCWAGAASAMFVSEALRGPALAFPSLLISMFLRMTAPLGLAIVARFRGGPLADAGLIYYLLIFYPVTLALETWMSLPGKDSRNLPPHATKKRPS